MKPLIEMTNEDRLQAYRDMYNWMAEHTLYKGSLYSAKRLYFGAFKISPNNTPQARCYLCEASSCCLVRWNGGHCQAKKSQYRELHIYWSGLTPAERKEQLYIMANLPSIDKENPNEAM